MSDKTRQFLKDRLDAYAGRHEKRDEEFASLVSSHVDAMANRKTLKLYLIIISSVNLVIWLSAIIFPADVRNGWSIVTEVSDRIGALIIALLFGVGLWLTYSLMRLRFPDVEDQYLDSELFGSVAYHSRARKRFFVWLVSVVGGVLNVPAIIFIVIALS